MMKNRWVNVLGVLPFISMVFFPIFPVFGMGGQFGLEFAIDAPWRIEPIPLQGGEVKYGPIPITITFHDAVFDHERVWYKRLEASIAGAPPQINVGMIKEVRVTEHIAIGGVGTAGTVGTGTVRSRAAPGGPIGTGGALGRRSKETPVVTIPPSKFWAIERKIHLSEQDKEPPHEVCHPRPDHDCHHLYDITESHEWHGGFWYTPTAPVTPGRDIHLVVTVITEYKGKRREWRNYLLVHAGEAPLPRFTNRWLYGDLHYHSQMTDNEGESAHAYRNVIRTLGAMGMDFVFATDHASNNKQVDGDLVITECTGDDIGVEDETGPKGGLDCRIIRNEHEARDLNPSRFKAAKEFIYGQGGVNELIVNEIKAGRLAGYQSHGVIPQIFMGEEVDAIPQMSSSEQKYGRIYYGQGRLYLWPDADGCVSVRTLGFEYCRKRYSKPFGDNRTFEVWDEQGIPVLDEFNKLVGRRIEQGFLDLLNDHDGMNPYPARQHIIYFPIDTTNSSRGFVSTDAGKKSPFEVVNDAVVGKKSNLGKYGGASRRLADVVSDIETKKGLAFLAHPLASKDPGGPGPDMIPYSDTSLNVAFKSPAILGLQFWNEDNRLRSPKRGVKAKIMGDLAGAKYHYLLPWGFEASIGSEFPWVYQERTDVAPVGLNGQKKREFYNESIFFKLYHGAYTWDKYLRKGLDPNITKSLPWLRKGEPRKWFMAGGSDSHGSFNFLRNGDPCADGFCDSPVTNSAIGTPRNLVLIGPPTGSPAPGLPHVKRYTNLQAMDALKAGRFSVTDGPALRIAVDRNRNGKIDDRDFQMGDTFHLYPGESIPLLVEWISTKEFGPVGKVDVYVGNKDKTFVPVSHGVPQPRGLAPKRIGKNGYLADPSGVLQVPKSKLWGNTQPSVMKTTGSGIPYTGRAKFYLHPQDFPSLLSPSGLFYLRAFVQTDRVGCSPGNPGYRNNQCSQRFAYSNPIWGQYIPKCRVFTDSARRGVPPRFGIDKDSLDMNRNGIPDTCEALQVKLDPCPLLVKNPLPSGKQGEAVRTRSIPAPSPDVEQSVTLEQPVHFTAIDGSDVLLEPGRYRVEPAEAWLKVVPEGKPPSEAVLIEAVAATHDEPLDTPFVVSAPGENEDVHQLALFLPDGKTLEARGSYSGIRKRGVQSFTRVEVKTLVPPPRPSWQPVPGERASDIGVGANGAVWIIGNPTRGRGVYSVYHLRSGTWQMMKGGAKRIAVGPNGIPWVIGGNNQVYQKVGTSWQKVPGPPASDIGVGPNGEVWIIGTDPLKGGFGIYTLQNDRWVRVPGAAVRIAVGPHGQAWVVNKPGFIYRREKDHWQRMPGQATDIGVGPNGEVWIIGTDPLKGGFGIYTLQNDRWVRVPGAATQISVGPQARPWLVNKEGKIFKKKVMGLLIPDRQSSCQVIELVGSLVPLPQTKGGKVIQRSTTTN